MCMFDFIQDFDECCMDFGICCGSFDFISVVSFDFLVQDFVGLWREVDGFDVEDGDEGGFFGIVVYKSNVDEGGVGEVDVFDVFGGDVFFLGKFEDVFFVVDDMEVIYVIDFCNVVSVELFISVDSFFGFFFIFLIFIEDIVVVDKQFVMGVGFVVDSVIEFGN